MSIQSAATPDPEDDRLAIYLEEAARQARAGKFKSNALVELIGGFKSAKEVRINGIEPIRLTPPQFIVLLILAAHARTFQGFSTPRRIRGGKFISAKEILEAINIWRAEDPALGTFWKSDTPANIHKTIFELRKKFRKAGANPNLIESAPAGEGGTRISDWAANVRIVLQ